MPGRGGGLNRWLFKAALALHNYRTPEEIIAILEEATNQEPMQPGEIERAVTRAGLAKQGKLTTGSEKHPKWPPVNQEQREAIIAEGQTLADLRSKSPIQCEIGSPGTKEVLETLFPGNPLICCATSQRFSSTRPLSEFEKVLGRQRFIVPSPMIAGTGITQDGKSSCRSLANTGQRRFLVIEQDQGTMDEQAAIILHLAQRWPLVLVVHSGGKSLHAWFYCHGQPEERQKLFMQYAVSLGADPATWTRSQLVRMPDGTRENGSRQAIHFFNPSIIK